MPTSCMKVLTEPGLGDCVPALGAESGLLINPTLELDGYSGSDRARKGLAG